MFSQARGRLFALGLMLALALRTAVLNGLYSYQLGAVQRHHVESAALAFLIVSAVIVLIAGARASDARPRPDAAAWEPVLWCASAVVLYAPVLSVGLLSDDFVLGERARASSYGFVHAELFRPLPLMVWSLILPAAGAYGLHVFNVLVHGFVAFLTSRVASAYTRSTASAYLAGVLVLVFPAAVETVAWNSAVFDLMATAFALATILAARQYQHGHGIAVRLRLLVFAIAAVASKETALVVPMLVALDAWAHRQRTRALWVDVGVLMLGFAAIGGLRVLSSPSITGQPLSRYMVQRWAFGTVGALAVPWHHDLATAWPVLPVICVVLGCLLVAMFVIARPDDRSVRGAAWAAGCILLGSLPTLPFFFVAADLQGSRYVYLPSVGYALMLCLMAEAWRRLQRVGVTVLLFLIAVGGLGGRIHQRRWTEAGRARDAALAAARRDERLQACRTVRLSGLPDTANGAYVFRNGSEIAFREVGLAIDGSASPGCVFEWDPHANAFR